MDLAGDGDQLLERLEGADGFVTGSDLVIPRAA
jgi:hypothetical protein